MSTIGDLYNNLKTLCEQWFYTKAEIDTSLSGKQATLVSGSNIKTVNNTSLLGSGDITVGLGGDWQTQSLSNMSGCTLYYNDLFCALKINKSGLTVSSVNTYANIETGTIPTSYRPPVPIVMRNEGTINVYFKVTDNGNVQMTSDYKPSASFTGKTIIIWARI